MQWKICIVSTQHIDTLAETDVLVDIVTMRICRCSKCVCRSRKGIPRCVFSRVREGKFRWRFLNWKREREKNICCEETKQNVRHRCLDMNKNMHGRLLTSSEKICVFNNIVWYWWVEVWHEKYCYDVLELTVNYCKVFCCVQKKIR